MLVKDPLGLSPPQTHLVHLVRVAVQGMRVEKIEDASHSIRFYKEPAVVGMQHKDSLLALEETLFNPNLESSLAPGAA